MFRKLGSVLLVLLLALSVILTGCGGAASGGQSQNAPVSAPPAQSTAAPEEPPVTTPAPVPAPEGEMAVDGVPPAAPDAAPALGAVAQDAADAMPWTGQVSENETYDDSPETGFVDAKTTPLSTFSSDVDTASYSNMRRMLNNYQIPTGIRVEELVNYFGYDYPRPSYRDAEPFTITTEVSACPWNNAHQLAMVGIQAAELRDSSDIANNIVFLLDVSGSMYSYDKLPLLQDSLNLMVDELNGSDRISIVTYAGSDEILADSIPGDKHTRIKRVVGDLEAGGSTAGAQGLRTAYELAEKNYIQNGNNRIILATDGDFNVGESSDEAMIELVEEMRDKGIFISVLGFGMGNLKDSKMESIADHGNGNYAYIDTLAEAKKVLVDEFDATMFVVAQDLKLQVEFNPAVVKEYRLIGYNNRRLADEDFNDDTKDAGDVGAGHSVTAFYELVLVDGVDEEGAPKVDDLKYQTTQLTGSTDYMTVKVRYKEPEGTRSMLVEKRVPVGDFSRRASQDFGFASAVAEFGLILTDSEFKANSRAENVISRAEDYLGRDPYGLREEFVELVRVYQDLL